MHLQLFGSGTDALVHELTETISMPLVVIDGDHVTESGVRKIWKERKTKEHIPTIYVGTELALHQGLDEVFEYTTIASLATLLALPSRIAELEAARVIEAMREKTNNTLLIQTRDPSHMIWQGVREQSWKNMRLEIIRDAKDLMLPPYATYIQIHISKNSYSYKKHMETMCAYIQEHIGKGTLLDITEDTIHIRTQEWPIDPLYAYIKSLPAYIRVEVDSPTLM
jgi:primosomal protein N'